MVERGPTQAWAPRTSTEDAQLKVKGREDLKRTVTPTSSDANATFATSLREAAAGEPGRNALAVTEQRSAGGRPSITSSDQGSRSQEKGGELVTSPSSSSVLHSYKGAPSTMKSKAKGKWKAFAHGVGRLCSCIAENKAFVFVGTFITVWALIGDDLKLLVTNRPVDNIFDGLVVFCIVFFTLEVLVCSLGKDDYFMSFFFCLDVLSTLTLFMDLTVVSEALFGDSDSDPSNTRTSRTARVGAKVGRIVRVLRLIRIVKLFKAFLASSKPKKKPPRDRLSMAEEDDDDNFPEEEEHFDKESLVGKKLSAKMTQRTIILVLTLLIVLPLLRVEMTERLPSSSLYAMDEILQAYQRAEANSSLHAEYQQAVLKLIYYHNWFTGRLTDCPQSGPSCSKYFLANTFWFGIGGYSSDIAALRSYAANLSLMPEQVDAWDDAAQTQNDIFNYGTLPSGVLEILRSNWTMECTINNENYIGFSLLGSEPHAVDCPTHLRYQEVERVMPRMMPVEEFQKWFFVSYFDLRPFVKAEAAYSMGTTAFVCVILCIASIFFTSSANVLVLAPVEKMMRKVELIRANPLKAMKIADDEFQREEMEKKKRANRRSWNLRKSRNPMDLVRTEASEPMETVILEKTIIKLGSLLALGFGEAGVNIVSSNMAGANSGVNAMVEGSMVDCIVGIARILNFSTATEVLQGKVMTFVNQIAGIVHGVVDECWGAVNKNDGDSFLIIWRLADLTESEERKMADLSVLAFSSIVGAVARSSVLAGYRQHPGLQQRLRDKCRVDLSFALHRGWAIEGAVGSDFKIDASYISPNVSVASSIEHATRKYGVRILVSQTVVELCSKEIVNKLRIIDKVTIKGSLVPLELSCLDLDFKRVQVEESADLPIVWNSRYRFKSRHAIEVRKHHLWNDTFSKAHVMKKDPHFQEMRTHYTVPFLQNFNMGYQNYSQGEWQVARNLLTKTHGMLSEKDGPSGALLRFMETPYQFKAPEWWRGVHALEDEF